MDKTIEIAPHLAGGVSAFKHDRSVIDVAFFGFESYWGTPTARPHSFRSEKKKKDGVQCWTWGLAGPGSQDLGV
jgi:hypothetical protein